MQLSLKEAWTRILDDARREIPEKDFKAWVEPAKPVALESDRLILGVPDEFAVQWNEAKNSGLFARLAERALGRPVSVIFRVDEDRVQAPPDGFLRRADPHLRFIRHGQRTGASRSTSATLSKTS
jgi:chromosomal replication initiator protein